MYSLTGQPLVLSSVDTHQVEKPFANLLWEMENRGKKQKSGAGGTASSSSSSSSSDIECGKKLSAVTQ